MPPDEFTQWSAYYAMEPWGAWRDNWHFANLSKLMFDINRGKGQPAKLKDFFFVDAEVNAKDKAAEFVARLKSMVKR